MQMTGSIHVDRPPEVVFPLWGALERAGEYLDGFERIKQTEGPTGAGTRWRAIDRWPGRTMEFTVEMVEWQPYEHMRARFSEPLPGGWTATFQATGDGGTNVAFETELRPTGLMGLLATLTKPWAGRQIQRFLTNFKAWAEAQPAT